MNQPLTLFGFIYYLCVGVALFAIGYGSYLVYGADMPIEQACEAVLKQIFNISVDFSGE